MGGVGSILAVGVWHPTDTGGGSSAAVAALIGALAVLSATSVRRQADGTLPTPRGIPVRGGDWSAVVYSVFFAVSAGKAKVYRN